MSEKKIGEHFNNLSSDTKEYIKSEIAYYKLDAYQKLIKATSVGIRLVIKVVILILLLLFLSITLAFYLGEILNHDYVGFLIVSGIYLIAFVLISLYGKEFISKKVLMAYNNIFKDIDI